MTSLTEWVLEKAASPGFERQYRGFRKIRFRAPSAQELGVPLLPVNCNG